MTESVTFLWRTYPFLWATLFYLGVLFLGIWSLPRGQQQMVVLSGLMNLPAAPFCRFLQGSYWAPTRLGGLPLGLEDILVSFLVAALAWLVAAWPFRHRPRKAQGPGSPWWRYALVGTPTAGFYLLLVLFAGVDPMTSLLVSQVGAGGALLLLLPNLWPLCVSGFLLCPPFYCLTIKLMYWIWPEFVYQWNLQTFWGHLIGGIPLGEVVWVMVYGASWPVYVGYVFQAIPLGSAAATKRGDKN
jgi:hypothetical protein